MGETVYVDLFFMINFSMDFLCLYLTSKILSRKMTTPRALMAAAVGGLYAVGALFFPFGRLVCLLLDTLSCAAICAIAYFERRSIRQMPLYILVYVAVSMALGGFMTALFNLLNRSSFFDGIKDAEGDGISVWLFALLAIVSAAITLIGGRFFRGRMSRRYADVELTYGGRRVTLHAMTDSGNLLCEPISNLPCIVADASALERLLPTDLLRVAKSRDMSGVDRIRDIHKRNLRMIPTSTASGEGMLVGIRMERISIKLDGREYEVDAILAVSDRLVGADGCNALLPPSLLVG